MEPEQNDPTEVGEGSTMLWNCPECNTENSCERTAPVTHGTTWLLTCTKCEAVFECMQASMDTARDRALRRFGLLPIKHSLLCAFRGRIMIGGEIQRPPSRAPRTW